jgi:hypothetical protein
MVPSNASLLEKPFPIERLSPNPVQQVTVSLRTDCFHQVTRQAVARCCVYVQNTHTGIETRAAAARRASDSSNA